MLQTGPCVKNTLDTLGVTCLTNRFLVKTALLSPLFPEKICSQIPWIVMGKVDTESVFKLPQMGRHVRCDPRNWLQTLQLSVTKLTSKPVKRTRGARLDDRWCQITGEPGCWHPTPHRTAVSCDLLTRMSGSHWALIWWIQSTLKESSSS